VSETRPAPAGRTRVCRRFQGQNQQRRPGRPAGAGHAGAAL